MQNLKLIYFCIIIILCVCENMYIKTQKFNQWLFGLEDSGIM